MRENRHRDESMLQREAMKGVCWMLVILLGCVSSHATECFSTNVSYGQLKLYCIPEQSYISVFVPCPNVTALEKKFTLFKDQMMIHKCRLMNISGTQSCEAMNGSKLDVHFGNKDNLQGFTANAPSQAIYTCEAEVVFPPPFLKIPSEQAVIVHAEGCHSQCNKTNDNDIGVTAADGCQMFLWIWISVVALLSTYSLAVSIAALIIWFKLKNADSQNDYMNTKPSRQRKHKNKVQNPIPRFF